MPLPIVLSPCLLAKWNTQSKTTWSLRFVIAKWRSEQMDHYLEEITKTSADADALELAASASTSISPNRFTEKLYQSMKWSLSVQPSSIASAGQVLPLFLLFFHSGSFSQGSNPSRYSPRSLSSSLLSRPSSPAPSTCVSTSSTFDWPHQFTLSRSISCR